MQMMSQKTVALMAGALLAGRWQAQAQLTNPNGPDRAPAVSVAPPAAPAPIAPAAPVAPAPVAAPAADVPPARTTYFWNSAGGADTAKAGKWGNGGADVSRTVQYEGASVLEVTTRNFREGARFDLNPGVPLEPYRASGYLRLRLRFRDNPAFAQPGAMPGMEGDPGAPPPANAAELMTPRFQSARQESPSLQREQAAQFRRPGGLGDQPQPAPFPGAFPGAPGFPPGGFGAFPGAPGVAGAPPAAPPQITTISKLSLMMVLDNGVVSGYADVDLTKMTPDEGGYYLFVMPLSQMRSTPGASGSVQRLILTSDSPDTFYLAQAALVVENGQITVSIRQPSDPPGAQIAEITVKPGQLQLVADVEAGAADPAVEWNFDADDVGLPRAGDAIPNAGAMGAPPEGGAPADGGAAAPIGPRVDARGLVVNFEYPNEEQNYRVEVTVRDRSGKKAPIKTSILVHVRA